MTLQFPGVVSVHVVVPAKYCKPSVPVERAPTKKIGYASSPEPPVDSAWKRASQTADVFPGGGSRSPASTTDMRTRSVAAFGWLSARLVKSSCDWFGPRPTGE